MTPERTCRSSASRYRGRVVRRCRAEGASVAIGAFGAAALIAASPTGAARSASPSETRAITAVVDAQRSYPQAYAGANCVMVVGILVSTINPIYARVGTTASAGPGCRRLWTLGFDVLKRTGSAWRLLREDSASHLECDAAIPPAVVKDLLRATCSH